MMRWRIESGPEPLSDDRWGFTLVRGRRSRSIQVLVHPDVARMRNEVPESLAGDVVRDHLSDRVPPDEVSLAPGWDFVRNQPTYDGTMSYTRIKGLRMRLMALTGRLNLPHWLRPRV